MWNEIWKDVRKYCCNQPIIVAIGQQFPLNTVCGMKHRTDVNVTIIIPPHVQWLQDSKEMSCRLIILVDRNCLAPCQCRIEIESYVKH